ncbi:hypothetical protein [Desulfonatronovibrio magnus]|uniref:hypothetical protein n=1 Tax=Desulfonatronovibrio magnus TaxID=698827 RepID=UPI0005EAF7C3|nr:hypothetical protein [Desulfonatronovibrio magnus]
MKYKCMKIVSSLSEEHLFDSVQDLRINTESGIIEVIMADSRFIMLFDRLKYFEVFFESPQSADVKYSRGLISLSSGLPATAIEQVINFDWKAEQGLFMVFAKNSTIGIHLDHLVSFKLENH